MLPEAIETLICTNILEKCVKCLAVGKTKKLSFKYYRLHRGVVKQELTRKHYDGKQQHQTWNHLCAHFIYTMCECVRSYKAYL